MKDAEVITGASRGIGRALALQFARRGHPLVLAARSGGGAVASFLSGR